LESSLRGSGAKITMPIFEYVCDDCGTKFEKLVRGNQAPDKCPQCGQSHLTTALSTFAAHANGKHKASEFPSCPGGMCRTPDLCGRN
jgi:putative FmdB family regulatory protein